MVFNFNPRTCEGATNIFPMSYNSLKISIHAPVKVRLLRLIPPLLQNLFQSTHLWRCDNYIFFVFLDVIYFNPRTCEGATSVYSLPLIMYDISIHAPVKVRLHSTTLFGMVLNFNPRTCEGATEIFFHLLYRVIFQSTHLWRCDIWVMVSQKHLWDFNPRTCEGATIWSVIFCTFNPFQSTHLWRCDMEQSAWNGKWGISIHAPVKVRQAFLVS